MRISSAGRVDRGVKLNFTFDGKFLTGFQGDTLASALIANGVLLMGRSFKYHRPRGVLGSGAEEPNALVAVDRGGGRYTPNLRATQVELYDGLVAVSQNRWPSLGFDLGALNDLIPIFSAGFYYKTFMQPRKAWKHLYEPVIRRMAGLGKAPTEPDPDHYTHRYAHCDVLVVGGGAAGLKAALTAMETGGRVILCDEQAEMGGGLLSEPCATIAGHSAQAWVESTLARLRAAPNVTLLTRTQAFGYFAQNFVALSERLTDHLADPHPDLPRERLWKVRAKEVVLAVGAIERPLVFANNDRPGVMLASAARALVNRYGVKPGGRAVLFAADDSGYAAASDLAKAGVEIALIADLRYQATPAAEAATAAGMKVLTRTVVANVLGEKRVSGVEIATLAADREVWPAGAVECDLLLMAGGWTPSVHLFSQSGGKLCFDEARKIYVPGQAVQDQRSVGACAGDFGIHVATGLPVLGEIVPEGGYSGAVPAPKGMKGKAFVDFQNDVTSKDIGLAVGEGFRSIEHIKRYTTNGMATDQGKTSNMNGLAIAAGLLGKAIPEVGLTTFRMPYTPVTFGSFAGHARGDLFDPVRRTPTHAWAEANGAVFEDVGQWKRAWYFPKSDEDMDQAVIRETRAVRETVGIFDASTLGKIEVVGPDAAEFLNRMYTNSWNKLGVGRCRYGVMLNEAGFVMDDGVIGRVAEGRFHVTTTTGGAAGVLHLMEDYLQTEFTDLKVWLTSATEQWAVIAVQGPRARDLLAPLVTGIDLSPAAMPHMSLREGEILGVPTRLFRVSFTGELGFEVNVPASQGMKIWEAIWAEGQKHKAVAYGTEAMHVLRAEKGYLIVGQETDGTVTPMDLGLDWAIGKAKPDFVGKRSLSRPDMLKPDRKQLVGLLPFSETNKLEEGAQIVAEGARDKALGHVTSSYYSAALGRCFALAMLSAGRSRHGETLLIPTPSGPVPATVTDPIFFDREGKRLDA